MAYDLQGFLEGYESTRLHSNAAHLKIEAKGIQWIRQAHKS